MRNNIATSGFRFGVFEFDPRTGELRGPARTVRLAPQPCRILRLLLSRAGRLVERDVLRDALWSSDTFVDFDLGLNYCVNRLRAVLGDRAHAAQFIETIPKRGYRFVAPVQRLGWLRDPAVAVLPFENLNRVASEEYLAVGVVDALVDALARERGVRVVSQHSIHRLKDDTLSIATIARALGVDAVVEGSTLRVGHRARISARLVQIEPERYLWVDCYEGAPEDVLALLSQVARQFSAAITRELLASLATSDAREEAVGSLESFGVTGRDSVDSACLGRVAGEHARGPVRVTLGCHLEARPSQFTRQEPDRVDPPMLLRAVLAEFRAAR